MQRPRGRQGYRADRSTLTLLAAHCTRGRCEVDPFPHSHLTKANNFALPFAPTLHQIASNRDAATGFADAAPHALGKFGDAERAAGTHQNENKRVMTDVCLAGPLPTAVVLRYSANQAPAAGPPGAMFRALLNAPSRKENPAVQRLMRVGSNNAGNRASLNRMTHCGSNNIRIFNSRVRRN